MQAWTDYPFERLGDKPNTVAPVREITITSYDGDKYCRIKVGQLSEEVKAGYIYQKRVTMRIVPLDSSGRALTLALCRERSESATSNLLWRNQRGLKWTLKTNCEATPWTTSRMDGLRYAWTN